MSFPIKIDVLLFLETRLIQKKNTIQYEVPRRQSFWWDRNIDEIDNQTSLLERVLWIPPLNL